MAQAEATCPMTREQVVDAYFLEHRAKLLDIAAYLDRLDRAAPDHADDFRMVAFRRALDLLGDEAPQRTRRLLELFSDHSTEPIDKAPMQGALGAAPLDDEKASPSP